MGDAREGFRGNSGFLAVGDGIVTRKRRLRLRRRLCSLETKKIMLIWLTIYQTLYIRSEKATQ
jgi:hypothetical protein